VKSNILLTSLLAISLVWSGLVFAGGGGGGGGSGSGGTTYLSDLQRSSRSDAYYEIVRCNLPNSYTNAYAEAITNSSSSKSKYLSHNTRLYFNGQLENRSTDVTRSVSSPSEFNYITSIQTARITKSYSCARAVPGYFEARGWHKGISIAGAGYILNTYDKDF
jgi:hypothetical protein